MVKNIVVISQEYPPKNGGAGIYAKNLFELLSDTFHTEMIFGRSSRAMGNRIPNQYGAPVFKGMGFIGLYAVFLYRTLICRKQYDVLLLNDVGAAFMAMFFFKKELRSKCICIIHGNEPEDIFDGERLLYQRIGLKNYYLNLLKNIGSVWFVSKDMREKMISRTGDVFRKNNIVYNFLDDKYFYSSHNKIKSTSFTLLTIGRVVKLKGFDRMLRIFLILKQRGCDIRWRIVGDGAYLGKFSKTIRDTGISDDVDFTGYLDQSALPEIISDADLIYLLSEYRESFGRVYIEGAALGCPGLGYSYGGVTEAITDGESGKLVSMGVSDEEIADVVEKIYRKEIVFDRIKIIEFAKLFSKNEIKKNVIALVNQL